MQFITPHFEWQSELSISTVENSVALIPSSSCRKTVAVCAKSYMVFTHTCSFGRVTIKTCNLHLCTYNKEKRQVLCSNVDVVTVFSENSSIQSVVLQYTSPCCEQMQACTLVPVHMHPPTHTYTCTRTHSHTHTHTHNTLLHTGRQTLTHTHTHTGTHTHKLCLSLSHLSVTDPHTHTVFSVSSQVLQVHTPVPNFAECYTVFLVNILTREQYSLRYKNTLSTISSE